MPAKSTRTQHPKLWRALALFVLIIAATLPFSTGGPVRAANGKPYGAMIQAMYCQMGSGPTPAQTQSWIKSTGVQLVRIGLQDSDCNDPAGLVPLLTPNGPITTVVLEAGGTQSVLYWNNVQSNFERNHGVLYNGQYWSYADLYNDFPNVTFYMEIGNEPDLYYGSSPNDGWEIRAQAIATYKQLENNACNDIAEAWSQKYPRLKWAIAAPAQNYSYLLNELQWEAFSGNTPGCNDDLNAGGVRDYYNVVTPHLYGTSTIPDGGTLGSAWQIYTYLVNDQYTRGVIVDEIGISDVGWPTKCSTNLHNVVNSDLAPYAKVDGYAWFYLGNSGNGTWVTDYQIPNQSDLAACSAW